MVVNLFLLLLDSCILFLFYLGVSLRAGLYAHTAQGLSHEAGIHFHP